MFYLSEDGSENTDDEAAATLEQTDYYEQDNVEENEIDVDDSPKKVKDKLSLNMSAAPQASYRGWNIIII